MSNKISVVTLLCDICHEFFPAKSQNQVWAKNGNRKVFCSDKCQKQHQREYMAEYRKANARRLAAKAKSRHKDRYERERQARIEYQRDYRRNQPKDIKSKHQSAYYQRTRTLQILSKKLGTSLDGARRALGFTKKVYVPASHFGVGNF